MAIDPRQLAMSQVCTLGTDFETDLAEFAAAGFQAVELWLTKLEDYLRQHTLDQARDWLGQHGLAATAGSIQGGLLATQGDARESAWQLFAGRIEILQRLNIPLMIVAADVPHPLTSHSVAQAMAALAALADSAESAGLRIGLEFQGGSAFINNLQTAVSVIEQLGRPSLGLCLDTFHFQRGPSKESDLELLNAANLFHVHVSDLADRPREFAADADRILPGEGEFPFGPLRQRLQEISYEGSLSLELMNAQFTQIPTAQFAPIAWNALLRMITS